MAKRLNVPWSSSRDVEADVEGILRQLRDDSSRSLPYKACQHSQINPQKMLN